MVLTASVLYLPGRLWTTRNGFVNLLRLRLSSDALVCHPGLTYPLGGPLRTCNLGPTLETLPHLLAVRRGRPQMQARSEVLGNEAIRRQKALGMLGGFEPCMRRSR